MGGELVDPERAVDYGVFTRRQARAAGYTGEGIELRVRRGQWVRIDRGLLSVNGRESLPGDLLLRTVLKAGPGALASHLSAAHVLGWDLLDQPRRPSVTLPRSRSRVDLPAALLFRRDVPGRDATAVGVLPLTCPLRTAIDIAADLPPVEAAVAIDSGLRIGQFGVGDLWSEANKRAHMPRNPSVRTTLSLVDPTSGSVPESVARLLFAAAGLPPPQCQYTITDDGVFLGRVDFAWPEVRLVVEIDGFTWHSSRSAFQRDHTRQRGLTLAGWTVLSFTADDVRYRPQTVVGDVRRALGL